VSNSEIHRGNVLLFKRTLADFILVVQSTNLDEGTVTGRYIDSPPDDPPVTIPIVDTIKLAEAQEREFPTSFLVAIEKQRQVIFAPPKTTSKKKSLGEGLKGVSDDVYSQILQILNEDNNLVGEEGGKEEC
jgi:hypothetical protein